MTLNRVYAINTIKWQILPRLLENLPANQHPTYLRGARPYLIQLGIVELEIIDFTRSLAEQAGGLVARTRSKGFSLGDRACLALAQREGVPAFTADCAWASLDIGIEIRLIR